MIKKWEGLEHGDIIDLVAPGSACTMAEIKASVKVVKEWGFTPRLPKDLFSGHKILAHNDKKRFQHLKRAIEAKDSKAVWSVRGGYGCIRLIPELKTIHPPKTPKIFLGFSDLTSLHYYFYKNWHWPTLHSPLFDRLGTGLLATPQLRRLEKIISGELKSVSFSGLKPLNAKAKSLTSLQAPILGGNLCTFVSHLGTSLNLTAKGHILFLEDLGERPHRVDRMLTQLEQGGVLKGCRAIVLGDFLVSRKDRNLLWQDVFQRFGATSGIALFKGLPVGHGKIQRTLPLGTSAQLKKAGNSFVLNVATGAR